MIPRSILHWIFDEPLTPEPRPVSDRSAIGLIILIAALGFIGVVSNEKWAEREEAKTEAFEQEQTK